MDILAHFQPIWSQAEAQAPSEFEMPPDGNYTALVEQATYLEPKDQAQSPCFVFTLQITEGEFQGMRFRKFVYVRNEISLRFLKGDLTTLGLPIPQNILDVPLVISSASGKFLDLSIRTKRSGGKDYRDTYFLKLVSPSQKPQQSGFQAAKPQAPAGYQPQPQAYQPQPQGGYQQQAPAGVPQQPRQAQPQRAQNTGKNFYAPSYGDDDIPF